jgi:adenylate cyclase
MASEIEHKFLVRDDSWRASVSGRRVLRQGYLTTGQDITVRVRTEGDRAWITIKGPTAGIRRAEFEYPIPPADADDLLTLCQGRVVEKTRHLVPHQSNLWEIDVFDGSNLGLVLAEIELSSESEPFELPAWVGPEVSDDRRYFNARLAIEPFSSWPRR